MDGGVWHYLRGVVEEKLVVCVILCLASVEEHVLDVTDCTGACDASSAVDEYGQRVVADEVEDGLGIRFCEEPSTVVHSIVEYHAQQVLRGEKCWEKGGSVS